MSGAFQMQSNSGHGILFSPGHKVSAKHLNKSARFTSAVDGRTVRDARRITGESFVYMFCDEAFHARIDQFLVHIPQAGWNREAAIIGAWFIRTRAAFEPLSRGM